MASGPLWTGVTSKAFPSLRYPMHQCIRRIGVFNAWGYDHSSPGSLLGKVGSRKTETIRWSVAECLQASISIFLGLFAFGTRNSNRILSHMRKSWVVTQQNLITSGSSAIPCLTIFSRPPNSASELYGLAMAPRLQKRILLRCCELPIGPMHRFAQSRARQP